MAVVSRSPLTEADLRHEVGTRLRLEREGQGLSIRAASQLAGVAPSYLRAVERGESTPSLPVLVKLVGAYGSSMTRLLAKIGTPPPVAGRLDDAPGWRELSEPTLNMGVYQVALERGGRTAMRMRGDGEVLVYVLRGAIRMNFPTVDDPLVLGDSVKVRHCAEVVWKTDGDDPSLALVGIGPGAEVVDVMVSASLTGPHP